MTSIFHHLGKAVGIYIPKYEKIVLAGDFNFKEGESFLCDYDEKNIVKKNSCFKNIENLSGIDIIITNYVHSFQNTNLISAGLSDFHMMVLTVLKTTFQNNKSRDILYKAYSKFEELKESLQKKRHIKRI